MLPIAHVQQRCSFQFARPPSPLGQDYSHAGGLTWEPIVFQCSHQACSCFHIKGGPIDLQLRASNEYLQFPLLLFGGVAKAALDCAHRTSTASSCAFCEQGGHLAAPPASSYTGRGAKPAGLVSDRTRSFGVLEFFPSTLEFLLITSSYITSLITLALSS